MGLRFPPETPGRFVAQCDACRGAPTHLDAPSFDAVRVELNSRGWLECPLRGKTRERWSWRCPQCNPERNPDRDPERRARLS